MPMTIRGGGDPRQAWLARRLREWARRLGATPLMRMTASWFGSTSDPPNTSVWRKVPRPMASSPRIIRQTPTRRHQRLELKQKARLAVHPPCACSGVKALRNTSCATAARRQAALAFRSLDPFRALRELIAGDGTKNGLSRSEQRTGSKTKRNSHPGNVTVTIDNRRSAFPDIAYTRYR